MDLSDDIAIMQSTYSKQNGHRLEVFIESNMDVWTCELGMEGWACNLGKGEGPTPREALNNAFKNTLAEEE